MAAASSSSPPNILVISVDCLRRDRISAYGYERQTTPFLDRVLESSLHATSAHSTSSWTTPAVASMFTGLYPHRHGAGVIEGDPANLDAKHLPSGPAEGIVGLPALLTGYVSGSFSDVAMTAFGAEGAGLFAHGTAGLGGRRSTSKLLGRARSWIDEQVDPFLCWVHLADPHDPLDVPRELRVFGDPERYRHARRWRFTERSADTSSEAFERYLADRTMLYDAAVFTADTAIGEFWTGLAPSLRERTILVVTADHGEELWEHRAEEVASFADPRDIAGAGHGQNLWQEILLVPMIVLGPGIEAGSYEENASLVDLAPTLLEAVGMEASPGLDGRSLLAPPEAERVLLAEQVAYGFQKTAVISGDDKLLVSLGDGYEGWFTLDADRREHAATATPAARGDRMREAVPGDHAHGPHLTIDPEVEGMLTDHLRELGYVE